MVDLPPGVWSAWLVGAWWPGPPSQPTGGITFWSGHTAVEDQESSEVNNLLTFFAMNNGGHTADDMIDTLRTVRTGIKRLKKNRDDCNATSLANSRVVCAVNNLRDRLTEISGQGNKEINDILSRQGSVESELPDINEVIDVANALAMGVGINANSAIATATQSMLNDMDVGEDAQKWPQEHGADFGTPPVRHVTPGDVNKVPRKGGDTGWTPTDGQGGDGGAGGTGSPSGVGTTGGTGSPAGGGTAAGTGTGGGGGTVSNPPTSTGNVASSTTSTSTSTSTSTHGAPTSPIQGASSRLPRIVQTVARAVARRSGVADNEIDLFRQVVTDTATRVLSAYPEHAPRDVADWMLLAAIDALIDGIEETARYHLAWNQTVAVRHGGEMP
ncbi:MAG: DUF5631 domain-containing protein [Mycobacterium sp.]